MANERVLQTYEYQGREVGKLVVCGSGQFRGKEFQTDLSEYDAIDLVREMPPETKVHMRRDAQAVYILLKNYELSPNDYVDNEDIMVHVANRGYRNLTELNRGDHRAWELVKKRGLEAELFQDFQVK